VEARPIPKERWVAATMRVSEGVGVGRIVALVDILGGEFNE